MLRVAREKARGGLKEGAGSRWVKCTDGRKIRWRMGVKGV